MCDSGRAWRTVEADKTILQETMAKAVGLLTRKHQGWFDEADKEIQELLKRNTPATIIRLQNLMIKLPRLHTRLLAVHSELSSGLCRMIGGQHLMTGHNAVLTWGHNAMLAWVTCVPSVMH